MESSPTTVSPSGESKPSHVSFFVKSVGCFLLFLILLMITCIACFHIKNCFKRVRIRDREIEIETCVEALNPPKNEICTIYMPD
nr:homolog of EHV2 ORF28 envelope glycoprotein 150 [Macronycteris gammaherpesvirus 1]